QSRPSARRGALIPVTGGCSVPVTRDAATGGRGAAGRTRSGRTDASRSWAPKKASSGIASAASASSMDIAYVPIASMPVVADIASSGSVAAPLPRFRSPSTRAAATLAPAASAVARTLRRVGPPPDGIRFLALSILYLSRQNDPLVATVRCRGCVRTVAFLAGCLDVVFSAAYPAYVPSLIGVDRVVEGNSKLATSSAIAEVGGPGLAGALVQIISAPFAILVDALSYLVSALSVALIRT